MGDVLCERQFSIGSFIFSHLPVSAWDGSVGPGVVGKWASKEGSTNGMFGRLAGQGADHCRNKFCFSLKGLISSGASHPLQMAHLTRSRI